MRSQAQFDFVPVDCDVRVMLRGFSNVGHFVDELHRFDEILKLKQEQGKDILVGGVSIPSQLMELGLVDEYRFVVQPIIAGEGTRLLGGMNLQERLQLKLVESKIFRSGCVALRYVKQ